MSKGKVIGKCSRCGAKVVEQMSLDGTISVTCTGCFAVKEQDLPIIDMGPRKFAGPVDSPYSPWRRTTPYDDKYQKRGHLYSERYVCPKEYKTCAEDYYNK